MTTDMGGWGEVEPYKRERSREEESRVGRAKDACGNT